MIDLKRLVYWLPIVLSVVALPFALASFYMVVLSRSGDTHVYEQGTLDSQEAADIAAQALQRAEENNDKADTILSLLEGGSVLLTLIVAAVAGIYTLNLRDLRQDLEGQAKINQEKVESALELREAQLDTLASQLTTQAADYQKRVDELTAIITQQLDTARQEAESSFRVLTLQLLAEQQVRARNYDIAINMLRDAHALEPNNQSTNYLLGYLYIIQRKFHESLDYLQKASQVAPDFAPAVAAIGLAQRRLGDREEEAQKRNRYWAEAEVNLIKALEMNPSLMDADGESFYGTLGGLYRRQNRHEDAVKAYEKAVDLTPTSSYPVGNLAVLYKYTGKEKEAQEMFARAQTLVESILEDRPGDIWARLDLAQSLLVQGKKEKAFLQYQEVVARKSPVMALKTALSTLEFLKQSSQPVPHIEEAIEYLQKAVERRQREEEEASA